MRVDLFLSEGRAVLKVGVSANAQVLSLSFVRDGRIVCGQEHCMLDFGCPVMPFGKDNTEKEALRVVRDVLNGLNWG